MRVSIERFGADPVKVTKNLITQFISMDNAMVKLGDETRDYMRNVISTTKHRKLGSRDNLENHINVYTEDGGRVVGIGSRAELDHFAPYWFIVNYGGMTTLAARGGGLYGSFDGVNPPLAQFAGTGVGHGSFFEGTPAADGKIYKMSPRNPIWAMNYIEKTVNWLSTVGRVHLNGALKKSQALTR